jgi:hypothetical protein
MLAIQQQRARIKGTSIGGIAADRAAVRAYLGILGAHQRRRAGSKLTSQLSVAADKTAVGTLLDIIGARNLVANELSTVDGATALIDFGRSVAASGWRTGAFEQRARLTHEIATPNNAAVLVKNRAVVVAKRGRSGTGWWRRAFLDAIGARAQGLGVSARCKEQYCQAKRSHHFSSTVG